MSRNIPSMLLLNGGTGISPAMAFRLSQAFGGTPEGWLQQQMQDDHWQTQKRLDSDTVRRFTVTLGN